MQQDLFGEYKKITWDLEEGTSKTLIGKYNKEVSRCYELFAQFKLSQLGFLIFQPPEQVSTDLGYTKEDWSHICKMQVKGTRPQKEKRGKRVFLEFDLTNNKNELYCKNAFPFICCVADVGLKDYMMFMHKNDGIQKHVRFWPVERLTEDYCKLSVDCFLAFHKKHNTYNIRSNEGENRIYNNLINVGDF